MKRRILVVNGHPDPGAGRFCAALAEAYAAGAEMAGHEVRRLSVGTLEFSLIRTREAFEAVEPPPAIRAAQSDIHWCQHLVIVHPLWLGSAPALLKGFLEQIFRYGFALPKPGQGAPRGLLAGRSARLIVTMGMPAAFYRLAFGAFGTRAVMRGILALSGFKPVKATYVGMVEGPRAARVRALKSVGSLGRLGQ